MDYDTAYAAFNGALPRHMRAAIYYGSAERTRIASIDGMQQAHTRRCAEILASMCAWRLAPYAEMLRMTMLQHLSQGLKQARNTACMIADNG